MRLKKRASVSAPGLEMRLRILLMMAAMSALWLTGCGVALDMAEDNEWRWGMFGKVNFISPLKLRVGVAPFSDEVGLGALEAGINMANLLSAELAKDGRLVVVPPAVVAEAMISHGYSGTLTPMQAAEIGTALNLNSVVVGSISEVKKYSVRKGWRRIARLVTAQREYVDAVLAVSAVDSQTGIVLVSRANVGEYDGGKKDPDFFEAGEIPSNVPTQEAMEASFNDAVTESFYRTLGGLATLPFKAMVLSSWSGEATIAYGSDVGLKPGRKFIKRELTKVITNSIGETYHVMGAAVAELEVVNVTESMATLAIVNGYVSPGDMIEAVP